MRKPAKQALFCCLFMFAVLALPSVLAAGKTTVFSSTDPAPEIVSATDRAKENGQRLLVIMGASWCHDSRALALRLERAPLKQLIAEHYQVVFVNVGNFDKGKDIITGFGVPVYYATPTVLIIDPGTNAVINLEDRHQWGDASLISMADTVAYFERMAISPPPVSELDPDSELSRLMTEIDGFEKTQADRLYRAYEHLSPMMAAFHAGDLKSYSSKKWEELRDYRTQVPKDLTELREQARQRVSNGETDIELDYPEYPVLSWEK